jgi:hypothetical protein
VSELNLGGYGGNGIRKDADGSITISPPAAIAAGQAPVPNGQLERPQPVAQIVINVPLSKVNDFLKMIEEWMTDEDWQHKQRGL